MTFAALLLPELDHESASTRRVLERVPEDKLDWRPHPKSMTLGGLAAHLAEIPTWIAATFDADQLDFAPVDGPAYQTKAYTKVADLLADYDANVAAARSSLAASRDEDYPKPWSLLAGGQVLFTMPKGAVLRSFVFSHSVHHRAQLGVYLRLLDIPVPGVYGPSADEQG